MTQTKPSATSSLTGKWNPYPAYKDSGVEWVGQIPEHWEVKRLKFFAKVNMGQSPDSGDYNLDGIGIPFLQGNAEFGQIHPEPRLWCETARKFASVMDVLLSVRAPVGQMNISNQIYGIGRGLCAITVQRQMDRSYFWFFLQVIREELVSVSTGSTYDAVSVDDVKRMTGFVPPLPEQRAIAIFLDREITKINALVAKKERMIELLQEKRAALISHAVTKGLDPTVPMKDSGVDWLGEIPAHWEVRRLKYLSQDGLVNGLFKKKDQFGTGIKLVNVIDLYKDNFLIDFESLDRVEAEQHEYEVYKVSPGDIFFVRSSLKLEGVGASACIIKVPELTVFECHLVRIHPSSKRVVSNFLINYLNSAPTRQRLIALAETTTMTTITQPKVAALEVVVPPLSEQQAIVAHLDYETAKIDALMVKIREGIEMLKEYSTGLISAAVTGKIDVRGEITAPEEIDLQVGDEL